MADDSIHAPEFPDDLQWLNADASPTMSSTLDGDSLVVLVFWSYCDPTSLDVFANLREVGGKFGDAVDVFAIHAPLFDGEKEPDSVRHAIKRYNVPFPVAVDSEASLKRRYGVSGVPTLVFVDPQGEIVGSVSGELPLDSLCETIDKVLDQHGVEPDLSPGQSESVKQSPTEEAIDYYPRSLAINTASERIAVSDSANHRVFILNFDGDVEMRIGGSPGDSAGTLDEARFRFPHGLTFAEEGLYLCDTGNHRVKGIDFSEGNVYNLLGNDRRGNEHDYSGPAEEVGLTLPMDLVKVQNSLWITMAGTHQIWRYRVLEEQLDSFLGTGAEGTQDGPHTQVTMSRPSGVTVLDETLYFLDAHASALRCYDPEEDWVETLIGQGLYEHGNRDGERDEALMQVPLDITADGDVIYIVDSLNHAVRRYDPEVEELETWLGTGEAGDRSGRTTEFYQPSGIVMDSDSLYVADTNNHRILSVDTNSWTSEEWGPDQVGISSS